MAIEMIRKLINPSGSFCLACIAAISLPGDAPAAVPANARIPDEFTGIWAEQPDHCEAESNQPIFTLSTAGFRNLPGEKAYPQVKALDRTGRHIRVSFYNSNGPLFWRSVEYFRLSSDGNKLEYRFADRVVTWVRCSGPIVEQQGLPKGGEVE